MNKLIVRLLNFYKKIISPFLAVYLGSACRHYPTCSEYSLEAFKKYNFFKALKLSFVRILSCNPLFAPKFDRV